MPLYTACVRATRTAVTNDAAGTPMGPQPIGPVVTASPALAPPAFDAGEMDTATLEAYMKVCIAETARRRNAANGRG